MRTLQAIFRRASVTQALLQCGTDGAPSDALTAARLARDGETPGPVRHGCSGFHAASILMSAYAGWSLDDYADPKHPSQVAVRETVARLFGRKLETLTIATDNCGAADLRGHAAGAGPGLPAAGRSRGSRGRRAAGRVGSRAAARPRRHDGRPGHGRRHLRPPRHRADASPPRSARGQGRRRRHARHRPGRRRRRRGQRHRHQDRGR